MPSASRSARSSPRTRWPTRMSMGRNARQSKVLPRPRIPERTGADLRRLLSIDGGGAGRHAAGRGRRSRHRLCAFRPARQPRAACLAHARRRADLDHRPVRPALRAAGRPRRRRHGDAAAQAIGPSWPPLKAFTVGADGDLGDPDGNWHEAYGVDTDGAVLVRPDGYVAWRSRSGASNPLKFCARRSIACSAGCPRSREGEVSRTGRSVGRPLLAPS